VPGVVGVTGAAVPVHREHADSNSPGSSAHQTCLGDLTESTDYRQRIEETLAALDRLPQGAAPDVRFGSDEEFSFIAGLVLRGLKSAIDT
jgi:hypothetical protein